MARSIQQNHGLPLSKRVLFFATFFCLYGNTCHQLLKKLNQILFRWHSRKIQMFMTYILSKRWMIETWRMHQHLHIHCYKWTMTMMNVIIMMTTQMIRTPKIIRFMIILKNRQSTKMMIPVVRILLGRRF